MDRQPSTRSGAEWRHHVIPRAVSERRARYRSARPGARSRRVPATHRRPNQRNRLLALLNLAIAVAAVIALVRVLGDGGHGSPGPKRTGTQQSSTALPKSTRELLQWVRANLPAGTRVLADPTVGSRLKGAGYHVEIGMAAACPPNSFIFLTPALEQSARQRRPIAGCINHSLTVASLGSYEVREVTADLAAAVRARRADLADRERGGAALADNPSIRMSAPLRTAVRDGLLDLRAQAVLAQLAALMPLRLMAIDGVPAETRAGLPARSVVIRVPNRAAAERQLSHVAAAYRPSQVVRAAGNTLRLTWPFRTGPLPVLN
ncbi:MAG TPA: hypothetical protein VKB75_02320 [Jatrophihabitans sp.]|nr:hypothetical protein [Jatrophihabitans sp.]